MADMENLAQLLQTLLSGIGAGQNAETENADFSGYAANNQSYSESQSYGGAESFGSSENFDESGNSADFGGFGNFGGDFGGFGNFGDLFGNIDLEMIMKLMEIFAVFQQPDKNTDLLLALRPHLREENQDKVDTAIKILKLTALLPFLRESGFMENLF